MGIEIEATRFETLPMGEYTAEIKGIVSEEGGMYGPQLKFLFEVVDGDYAEQNLIGWCSATFNPKSKLWGWTQAALGADFDESRFRSDPLIGRRVRLAVSVKTDKQGVERNKVESILPLRRAAPRPVATGNGVATGGAPAAAAPHWYEVKRFKDKWEAFCGQNLASEEDYHNVFGVTKPRDIILTFDEAMVEFSAYFDNPELYMQEEAAATSGS